VTTAQGTILVIDDEAPLRHMLRLVLEKAGYRVIEAAGGAAGLECLAKQGCDTVLCDIRMPEMDGLAFLKALDGRQCAATVIMMSAYGTIDTAVACLKAGAYDYISKPFKPDEILLTLKKAEERQRLQRENVRLRRELAGGGKPKEAICRSREMTDVFALARKVADAASPVLVTGETGTGKELVARALHFEGSRGGGPFVTVNCSAIAANLIESELFGHARGAFTGADRQRAGLFAAADGGTLFLDEIGELPLPLQPKLLRVIQEGEVRPVGETQPRRVDVRVVAATARDLKTEICEKRFRDDLYYRLAVVEIHLPPLRERREDIALLAEHFITRLAAREGRPAPQLTASAREVLTDYSWPGNVRELENFIEKTMIFCREERIDRDDLPWEVRRRPREDAADLSLKEATARIEREYIRRALAATEGNRTHAARLLEISLRALVYKIKDYGLD